LYKKKYGWYISGCVIGRRAHNALNQFCVSVFGC